MKTARDLETDATLAALRPVIEKIRARKEREREEVRRRIAHEVKLRQIQIDGEIAIAAIHRTSADLRRKEEALAVADNRLAMKIYRGKHMLGQGKTPVSVAAKYLRIAIESDGPLLEPYHSQFVAMAATRGLEIRWVAHPGVNAYALPKWLELPQIRTQWSYAVGIHEVAHWDLPCQPSHRRVPRDAGRPGTLCVRCEIEAWEYAALALAHQTFTTDMHSALKDCLPTYRRFGTSDEQLVIDQMCSSLWRAEICLKRAMRSTTTAKRARNQGAGQQ